MFFAEGDAPLQLLNEKIVRTKQPSKGDSLFSVPGESKQQQSRTSITFNLNGYIAKLLSSDFGWVDIIYFNENYTASPSICNHLVAG